MSHNTRIPKLRRQTAFNEKHDRAFVELNGQRKYCGVYGSIEATQRYNRLIADWLSNERQPREEQATPTCDGDISGKPTAITVAEIAREYWDNAKRYYRKPGGTASSGLEDVRFALRPLIHLHGLTPAEDFGPKQLKAIREWMFQFRVVMVKDSSGRPTKNDKGEHVYKIEKLHVPPTRRTINGRIIVIKRVFEFAVENERIGGSGMTLRAVKGLRKYRSDARESEKVQPVSIEHVDATRPFLSRQVEALIDLQLLTGARPGELVGICASHLDTSSTPWKFRMGDHKTAHHDHHRTIRFGPQARAILANFMTGRPVNAPLFSPKEAAQERREKRHAKRKTPLDCGNVPGSSRCTCPKRPAKDRYTVDSYRRAIQRACDAADAQAKHDRAIDGDKRIVPRWHPHQLRHTNATSIRSKFGIDVAQPILGHARGSAATERYAEVDESKADHAIELVG